MAVMWWFATLVLFLLLVVCIVFVIYALKSAIHTEDAVTIDPLPEAENSEENAEEDPPEKEEAEDKK
ncbi:MULTISPECIES: hypothetical protein [Metabacillus]|uniref:hypothetical protein n=1 Tax=Metabacillus TaxID=2675233 RepID=UPI0004937ACB|nr:MULTISPECIES: hypothetical protein [Metabacillus]KEZ48050.1 hypothetical protein AZ46_0218905 [Metabacillus indicus LMG 22858]